jgi:hypothetical protein
METINPVTISPSELKTGDRLGFKIIAVVGYAGDWCAYRGLTDWTDEEVARSGDRIEEDTARALFYALNYSELKYRD